MGLAGLEFNGSVGQRKANGFGRGLSRLGFGAHERT